MTPPPQRKLKALHLASFVGNIGDNAMHDGARRTRQEDMATAFSYTPIEVRDFIHWGKGLDEDFIDLANNHDLVVIGGFSLFQLWREGIASGIYLDVAPSFFARISTPVVFYGVGSDATRGVVPATAGAAADFLRAMSSQENVLLSFRNDGTRDILAGALGEELVSPIPIIPDGGMFAQPGERESGSRSGQRNLVINIAGDMAEVRYGEGASFTHAMARLVEALTGEDEHLHVTLVPHIYSDFAMISALLEELDDRLRRTRVSVAPYSQGERGWQAAFDIYRRADLVIAMRYHANLASIGFATPVIGISTHHKIAGQYTALGLQDRCFAWPEDGLEGVLHLARKELKEADATRAELTQITTGERERLRLFHLRMQRWLDERRGRQL